MGFDSITHFHIIPTRPFGVSYLFLGEKIPGAVVLLLLPEDKMSGMQGDEPLPSYEETERASPTPDATDTAAANANRNPIYNDRKSAISTTQQVSATSDNSRASRMCDFTRLLTVRQLLTRHSAGSVPMPTTATKLASMGKQMLPAKRIRMLLPPTAIPMAE